MRVVSDGEQISVSVGFKHLQGHTHGWATGSSRGHIPQGLGFVPSLCITASLSAKQTLGTVSEAEEPTGAM